MASDAPIDPVCLFHGKRRSEHECLYCCLCFKTLTRDECSYLPDGTQQDVCVPCAEQEREYGMGLARAALRAGLKPEAK